ncbi:AraC family transcriptional regulator [Spirosoma linguale]|uniref:Transcriptional regulator, AraC family n=1 Tax=Spirosoma linguale (strain ATCC 33905 / DSM 74 / LMG 10896 / Claus 1) TaxID=504472 RepID=D2QLM0_SPILD|nr:transcriptional regulator, AraC family [Spirosoma linguale DSM 74]
MKRSTQHELLLVQQFETSLWPFPSHTHNHFELILIRSGTGHHHINGNRFVYQAGDVFLLGPLDCHTFAVNQKTCFCCLSFTDLYMASLSPMGTNTWPQIREHGLTKHQPLVGSLVTDGLEQQNLFALFQIIMAEQNAQQSPLSNPVIESLMKTILSIVDRQLLQYQLGMPTAYGTASSLRQRIGTYIHRYITEPDYLRLEKMADVFNYSQRHLGALFKQQTGESIQQYIIRYKLQLVETRLRLSTLTVSQIADEFGFTDVCHLNKLFKRYYRQTPTGYRRELSASLPAMPGLPAGFTTILNASENSFLIA